MKIPFLVLCFFTGLTASFAIGPIFVLTFNRGALYGFWKGFATAIGSSIADGIFFGLGLLGALTLFENSKNIVLIMDLVGAATLFYLGLRTIKRHDKVKTNLPTNRGMILSSLKSFFITIINPLIALFFMFISLQIAPDNFHPAPLSIILIASTVVSLGSLTTLSLIAFIASSIGNAISKKKLSFISYCSGVIFILLALYLLVDFIKNTLTIFNII